MASSLVFPSNKEVGMLSRSELLSIRFSIGQAIKLSSAITLLTLASATVAGEGKPTGMIFDPEVIR
jgi:hypothetical protein